MTNIIITFVIIIFVTMVSIAFTPVNRGGAVLSTNSPKAISP